MQLLESGRDMVERPKSPFHFIGCKCIKMIPDIAIRRLENKVRDLRVGAVRHANGSAPDSLNYAIHITFPTNFK
jgi:hypothetical protein